MLELPDAFERISLTALPPDEREALLRVLDSGVPARGLRLRPSVLLDTVNDALPDAYPPVPWSNGAHYLDADSRAGAHPLHAAGAYYLQEPSAMAAAEALGVRPGQRVLDLCAAPGGKSTQIAAMLRGEGVLVANEIVSGRAKILSQNMERMGAMNAIVTNGAPDRLARAWPGWFDRVLVDAPCSGEGMFRREPESRREWNEKSPGGCAARQRQILDAAAELLRDGGVLVYSTCTFNAIENEGVVASFLAAHPDFAAEDFALAGVGESRDGCLRLWPHRLRGEGHFVARMRKGRVDDRAAEAPDEGFSLATLWPEAGEIALSGILRRVGDRCWAFPAQAPPLDGIRALRTGLSLGEWRGKAFVPDHALAMALCPPVFPRVYDADGADTARYLRGETMDAAGSDKGWTLVSYRGLSLGWAKCADGMLKNHLPKGLRQAIH